MFPTFDGHNDILFRILKDPAKRQEIWLTGEGKGHLDLPRMIKGGLAAGFFAIYVPSPHDDEDIDYQQIMSNPPYLAADEWADADPELGFEPRLALDGGRDGLDAFRVLTTGAPRYLRPGGWLILEHGFRQGADVRALLKEAGFGNLTTTADLAGRPRVSEGQLGSSPGHSANV